MSRDNIEHGWIGTEDRESDCEKRFVCGWCGEYICEGDEYYDFYGEKVCQECVDGCKKYA